MFLQTALRHLLRTGKKQQVSESNFKRFSDKSSAKKNKQTNNVSSNRFQTSPSNRNKSKRSQNQTSNAFQTNSPQRKTDRLMSLQTVLRQRLRTGKKVASCHFLSLLGTSCHCLSLFFTVCHFSSLLILHVSRLVGKGLHVI